MLGRRVPYFGTSPRRRWGIDVTYHQDGRVLVESRPRVVNDGVGGLSPQDDHPGWRLQDWEVAERQ